LHDPGNLNGTTKAIAIGFVVALALGAAIVIGFFVLLGQAFSSG
jgi:hypothetical protein